MTTGSPSGGPLLRTTVRQQRGRLLVASGLFISHQIGEVLVPVVAGAVIDRAVVTGDPAALGRWLGVLALVFAVLSTSWRLADRVLTGAVEDAAHDLRLRLTARFLAPVGVLDAPAGGQVVSVATGDIGAAARILVAVAAGLAASAALVTTAVILLVISVPLGLVVLVGLPVVVFALQALVSPLERRTAVQRADAADAASLATDLLTGVRVLTGLRAGSTATARYRAASRRSLTAGLAASRLSAVHEGATVMATGTFIAVVALVAGVLAADGDISIGGLVAAVGVTQFLVGPLWRIGFAAATFAKARASATRVVALLEAPGAVDDGAGGVPDGDGAVVFRGVSSRGLHGVDLAVEGGAFVALAVVEPRDAVALVDLLGRSVDPDSGTIELDGAALPSLDLDALRRSLVVARHDGMLFSGTVAEVVADAARGGAPDVEGLLTTVAADDLHEHLPEGIDTPVLARGASLSGGQRQRLGLARALATTSRVLVLHDPTTAIDPVTEARVAAGLREQRRGATTIVLTTSPALLAVADRVVLVEAGRVADTGTHEELLARNERYAATVLA